MRVHIATDHAAFELKEFLMARLVEAGHEVIDHGASTYDASDDYPDFILPMAQAVAAEQPRGVASFGIALGGSGNGEQVSANKVRGIRAILATSVELAELGREHNNANVLAMGGRFVAPELAWEITQTFLATPFSTEARHARRIALIDAYEASHHAEKQG